MDNLTHTLLGALAGEAAARLVPVARSVLPEPTRRTLFLSLMVIGNNLPDADLLYSFVDDSKLGYMLHHRGHTHTVIGALLGGLLMLGACAAWLRWRRFRPSRHDWCWLVGVALLAPLLHLAMDFMNNYGVHPFWPLFDGWLYGDTLFIVEPLFWVAAAVPLAFLFRSRPARALMGFVALLAIGLGFGSGFVPVAMAGALTLLAAALALVAWRTHGRATLLAGIGAWLGIIAVFASGHRDAARATDALAAATFPGAATLDRVLTPMPANPLCWEVILAQTEGEMYVLRRAMLALAPDFLPAVACPSRGLDTAPTAPLVPMAAPASAAVQWYGEFTMPRAAFAGLTADDCEAAAFLRFARMPWFAEAGGRWRVGDLRYDREAALAFSELALAGDGSCPRRVPPWTPPRADLLDASRR